MLMFLALQLVIVATGDKAPLNGANHTNVEVRDAYRAVETWPVTDYTGQTTDGLVATNLRRSGVRLRGKVDRVTIRNFQLEHGPVPNASPDLPAGIAIEAGRGITIENGTARGFRMVEVPGKYTNGDGFSTERPVVGVTFRNVGAEDNSDGGFDLKSTDTRLDGTVAIGNGKSYRLWGTGTAGTIVSINPRLAHVSFHTAPVWEIDHLIAVSSTTAPILFADGVKAGTRVVIKRCTLVVPKGTPLFKGKWPTPPVLGPGCQP